MDQINAGLRWDMILEYLEMFTKFIKWEPVIFWY